MKAQSLRNSRKLLGEACPPPQALLHVEMELELSVLPNGKSASGVSPNLHAYRGKEWGGGGGRGDTESYKRERSLWGEPERKKQRGQALQLEEQRPQNPEGWMECEREPPQLCMYHSSSRAKEGRKFLSYSQPGNVSLWPVDTARGV